MKLSKNWEVKVTWYPKKFLSFVFNFLFNFAVIIAFFIFAFVVTIATILCFGEECLIFVLGACLIAALLSVE